jgi:hypothetical protein
MERAMKRLLLWFDDSSAANPAENQLVKDLIAEWERQVALTPYDGLPLLSQSFRNPVLRKFAVQILKKNEQGQDESMQQMLLQLVQALRYEEQINASPLAELLVKRSQRHEATAYALNWFLTAEMRTDPRNLKFQNVIGRLSQALTKPQQASVALQNAMVDELVAIASQVKTLPAKQRVSALRDMLQKSVKFPFSKFANLVPLPIDPQLKANRQHDNVADIESYDNRHQARTDRRLQRMTDCRSRTCNRNQLHLHANYQQSSTTSSRVFMEECCLTRG